VEEGKGNQRGQNFGEGEKQTTYSRGGEFLKGERTRNRRERRGNRTESKKSGMKTRGEDLKKKLGERRKAEEKGGRTTGCCQHSHLQLPSSSPSSITASAPWETGEEAKKETDRGNHSATKKEEEPPLLHHHHLHRSSQSPPTAPPPPENKRRRTE
jgi:hypothetical protein